MAEPNREQNSLYFLLPLLLLAAGPDMEEKIIRLGALLQATRESAQVIRTGLQTFKASMVPPGK